MLFALWARFEVAIGLTIICSFGLLLKSLMGGFAGLIDFLCGIAIFLGDFYQISGIIYFVLIIFLLQKGVISLI